MLGNETLMLEGGIGVVTRRLGNVETGHLVLPGKLNGSQGTAGYLLGHREHHGSVSVPHTPLRVAGGVRDILRETCAYDGAPPDSPSAGVMPASDRKNRLFDPAGLAPWNYNPWFDVAVAPGMAM